MRLIASLCLTYVDFTSLVDFQANYGFPTLASTILMSLAMIRAYQPNLRMRRAATPLGNVCTIDIGDHYCRLRISPAFAFCFLIDIFRTPPSLPASGFFALAHTCTITQCLMLCRPPCYEFALSLSYYSYPNASFRFLLSKMTRCSARLLRRINMQPFQLLLPAICTWER